MAVRKVVLHGQSTNQVTTCKNLIEFNWNWTILNPFLNIKHVIL